MQNLEPSNSNPVNPTEAIASDKLAVAAKWRQYRLAKESNAAQRRHTRHDCSSIGVLAIVNRSTSLEGIVTEISKGGIKFRPASTHLLNRNGTQISVSFASIRVTGKIVATRVDGYGVALFEELEDDVMEQFLLEQQEQSATQ